MSAVACESVRAREGVMREAVRFRGGRGALAGELAYPWGAAQFCCLLVNPHPFMGGSIGNRLVKALSLGLAEAGAVTLRFDYGGVGLSGSPPVNVAASMAQFWQTGSAPEDPALVEDARYAARWLRSQSGLPLTLVGYSFGAYAAACLTDESPAAMVLISPTVGKHDFGAAVNARILRLVLYGDDDFATPAAAMEAWLRTLRGPYESHRLPGGQHFFRGKEEEVVRLCRDCLVRTTGKPAGATT